MPNAPLKPCRQPGCPNVVTGGYCDAHAKARPKRDTSHHRQRKTGVFKAMRNEWLREHPTCVTCGKLGNVLDHIRPHRGDDTLFWDWRANWATLCRECHNSKTARGG